MANLVGCAEARFDTPVDTVVIGAGVVGLAVGRALALAGLDVMVLEQHSAIGTQTSARNSEVVHAGLYYPTGSLKAQLCVQGNALLHAYAAEKGFALRDVGKLIVATHERQFAALEALYQQSQANGVPQVTRLSAAQATALEPQLRCTAALHSASTGIVDSHGFMLALHGDIEAAGASVVCHAQVLRGQTTPQGTRLHVQTPDGAVQLLAQRVVNCGGLHASHIACSIHGLAAQHIPSPYYAKGSYYHLAAPSPFQRLIYPLPSSPAEGGGLAGLGVHLTLDLGGQARFGPDVEWLDISDPAQIDFAVDPARAEHFYEAVRQYWPDLPDNALQPAYSGVRPKISPPSAKAADFRISTPSEHGAAGIIHLFGIESPGLTASLAIAQHVAALMAA